MNPRLAEATSPYLRAHAGNPVAWFPWGEEAFAEARRRDVPVMVSIGYSTCHWCHVMARESFEDDRTAAELDAGFVSIKVDREEHPEVDAAYMAAAAAFAQSLGWPLTVFATPEGRPFYAGTYFPPEPRAGMPSFRQVLAAVREAWTERRDQIDATADAVADALADVRAAAPAGDVELPTADELAAAAVALAAREDPRHGGFGDPAAPAPKFPVATALRFLQSILVRDRAPEASAVADRALEAMASSELRDRVEGGFFRYATRPDWTVPHYERMLTDNAQLLDVAMDAAPARQDVARGVAGFLTEVLQQPGGGFGAAQDSESWIAGVRSEGGYYLRDATARELLEAPAVDGKVVTGWNGLAIGALARAGARLGEPSWIEAARWAADAVLEVNIDAEGRLVRASLDEVPSRARATLADHGQLASGLLALAAATGEVAYAVTARALVDACAAAAEDDGGAAVVPGGGDPLLSRQGIGAPDTASDADEPSGAASLAEAAAALWILGAGDDYRVLAGRLVGTHIRAALSQPLAYGGLLRVATTLAAAPRQVVVVSADPDAPMAGRARGIRADAVVVVSPEQAAAWADAGFGLFADKAMRDGRPTAYDCRDFACRLPVTDPAQLDA
ncbi:thioredoxin domain-containing protein [Microbacterium sp. NPDC056736]|uniref:thioredoxin domain-containing protein n=1 Tax=Microbacterium sp. NPDC056736 TaxID=3345932 RepID=UPI00366D9916